MAAPTVVNAMLTFSLLVISISLTNAWIPRFLRGRPRGGMLGSPTEPKNMRAKSFPELWFIQKQDNFNNANTAVWKQRYFMEDSYYKNGGPVFVMIGGEGPANPAWMSNGAWIDFAKTYNAMCFQLEHRYYGKSHPTSDMSTENLQYLSSEQALADLANFIQYTKSKYKLYDNKYVTFGGSYSGALSAWFRLKYPHLATGAVATSAPIFAKLNFTEYLGVVKESLATTGTECNVNIQLATKMIEYFIQTVDGRKKLKETFALCDDLDISNPLDIANFYSTLAGNFEGVVQYNKDNRKFEGGVGSNITIDILCGIMNDDNVGSPLVRFGQVNSLLIKTYSEKCTDFNYKSMINDLKKTDWNSSAAEGGRQWTYQTCTEFAYFQSSDLPSQPFGHHFPLNFSVQQCMDIFGQKFNEEFIQIAVNRTNINYGGYAMKASKTVFPNGSIDPWHALSFTETVSPDAPAIYIDGRLTIQSEDLAAVNNIKRAFSNYDLIESRFKIRNIHLQEGCRTLPQYYNSPNSEAAVKDHLIVDKRKGIVYCSIEKIGCTFWKRLFQILSGFRNVSNPFAIKGIFAYEGYETAKSLTFDKIHQILKYATKFMFVREPYERLMSGYVDKLFSPNAAYWNFIGRFIVKNFRKNPTNHSLNCGHDVTFPEFVQYFIHAQTANQRRDAHFVPSFEHCRPCEIEYDYIGKLETFKEDTFHILRNLNLENIVKFSDFQNETEVDAILDSVDYIYSMRNQIVKCMPLNQALFRTWRKLQIRGLLSKEVTFPYSLTVDNAVPPDEFKRILLKAHAQSSSSEERKKNREEAFIEAYSSVTRQLFDKLKQHLVVDSTLFGYEEVPKNLYKKIARKGNDKFGYFEFLR